MREDWRKRIQIVVNENKDKQLSWGEHDCFTFMSQCYEAFYGEQLLDVRGKYKTLKGAVKYYHKLQETFEEDNIIEYMDRRFGRCKSSLILHGDIVARPEPDTESSVFGYAFGTVINNSIAFVAEHGVVFLPLDNGDYIWRPSNV